MMTDASQSVVPDPVMAQDQDTVPDESERRRALRLKNLCRGVGEIVILGLAYFVFTQITHLYIPCLFRTLTGWLCPGCGISHLFVALFRLDFKGAFAENPFVFVLLPVALLYGGYRAWCYVNDKKSGYAWWEIAGFTAAFAGAIIFGVLRNL